MDEPTYALPLFEGFHWEPFDFTLEPFDFTLEPFDFTLEPFDFTLEPLCVLNRPKQNQ